MIGKKGTLSEWLSKLIKIVILVLIAFAVYGAFKAFGENVTSAMSVTSSATDMADAINDMNNCINEHSGHMDCTNGIQVNVSVPQTIWPHPIDSSIGVDPLWIIYHDYCVSKRDDGNNQGDGWNCRNAPDGETVLPSDCECSSFWDSGIFAPRCHDALCYGLIENFQPGVAMIDKQALDRLDPFYIIDPCYASVRVRENPAGRIEICFEEELGRIGAFNFCYSEYNAPLWCVLSGSHWPDSHGTWDDGYKAC